MYTGQRRTTRSKLLCSGYPGPATLASVLFIIFSNTRNSHRNNSIFFLLSH